MVVERKPYVSRAAIRKHVKSIFPDDPDIAVDILLREISRRKRHCLATYPFELDGTGVRYVPSNTCVPYLFMLCISVSRKYREEHRQIDTDEFFDELVLDALKHYLGAGSDGLRFGAPASGDRPKNFEDAIYWLANRMHLPKGRGRARRTGGDRGLDVIVWRPFRDKRSAYVVMMAQCTVQIDWFQKARDLSEDAWRGWVDLGKDPHLVLALPFVISMTYDKWDELRRHVHTILDRLRLAQLLDGVALREFAATKRWTASEIAQMSRE